MLVAIFAMAFITGGFFLKSQTLLETSKVTIVSKKNATLETINESVKSELSINSDYYFKGENNTGEITSAKIAILKSRVPLPSGFDIASISLASKVYSHTDINTGVPLTFEPEFLPVVYNIAASINYQVNSPVGSTSKIKLMNFIGKDSATSGVIDFATLHGSPLGLALYWRAKCALDSTKANEHLCNMQKIYSSVAFNLCVVVTTASYCMDLCTNPDPIKRPDECGTTAVKFLPGGKVAYDEYFNAIGTVTPGLYTLPPIGLGGGS
jgi:hypothetical protein